MMIDFADANMHRHVGFDEIKITFYLDNHNWNVYICHLPGVKNMAKAYVSLPGNHKKESLSNVKFGYKECTQVMRQVHFLMLGN